MLVKCAHCAGVGYTKIVADINESDEEVVVQKVKAKPIKRVVHKPYVMRDI
jgi:hypothetical protein